MVGVQSQLARALKEENAQVLYILSANMNNKTFMFTQVFFCLQSDSLYSCVPGVRERAYRRVFCGRGLRLS